MPFSPCGDPVWRRLSTEPLALLLQTAHTVCRGENRAQLQVHAESWTPPWAITFDIRERETQWTSENQARLVKLFAAEKLDMDIIEAELRVAQLCLIVPNLSEPLLSAGLLQRCLSSTKRSKHAGSRLKTMKPEVLAGLLRDPSVVANRLADLRQALPRVDISSLVSTAPQLLLRADGEIVEEVWKVAEVLAVDFEKAQEIVSSHPRFLEADLVREVLEELRRLMPGRNASAVLQAEPTWLLRVERGPKRLGPHPDDI